MRASDRRTGTTTATTSDGTYLTIHLAYWGGYANAYLTTRSGATLYPPVASNPSGQQGSFSATDANGNQIYAVNGVYTDTLGQQALTVLGAAPSPTTLSYTAPSGGIATYTVNYKPYTVQTNFQCYTPVHIQEYNQSNIYLVDNITLPDSTKYSFTYEATPGYSGDVTGRLASVQLPTGGIIAYTYNYADGHNGIVCGDGSTDGLVRTLNGGLWNYTRTLVSGSEWQTTATTPVDPQTGSANNTVINFQKDSSNSTASFYETQRQTYQGAVSPSNLLQTTVSCYNGNLSSCLTTPVSSPIAQVNATLQFPNNQQTQTVTFYNSSGLVSEVQNYAYGSPAPGGMLQDSKITYANLGNGFVDPPLNVSVYDGSTHLVSETTYAYDEYSTYPLQTTTGTPNHVAPSGARGNATTITH